MNHTLELVGTAFFALAILHGFSTTAIARYARRFKDHGPWANFLHLAADIEVPFGLWAFLLIFLSYFLLGHSASVAQFERIDFAEPTFVFVILLSASTAPVLNFTEGLMRNFARLLPVPKAYAYFFAAFFFGPLLGSFITEPAAMTVTASFVLSHFFSRPSPAKFRYAVLALLLINISLGGALTNFSAPPILMVAAPWGWSTKSVFLLLGERVLLCLLLNVLAVLFVFRRDLTSYTQLDRTADKVAIPPWVTLGHLVWLVFVVLNSHHPKILLGFLPIFLGFYFTTARYQHALKLKESLMVCAFLGGLIVLGQFQSWWLAPVLQGLQSFSLFAGAIGLTAILDNAALTYLGAQVPALSEAFKYYLVSGALIGGGLTLIANAPNPIAASLLAKSFEREGGINALHLFAAALPLTLMTALIFWITY